jgi:hypothetical protein
MVHNQPRTRALCCATTPKRMGTRLTHTCNHVKVEVSAVLYMERESEAGGSEFIWEGNVLYILITYEHIRGASVAKWLVHFPFTS